MRPYVLSLLSMVLAERRYEFKKEHLNNANAQKYCKNDDGELALIETKEQSLEAFTTYYGPSDGPWIGVSVTS